MLAEARVGTSGFSYREWVGTVYPAGLSEAQTLALYASQLGAVEVQSRLPDEATLEDWAEAAPPGFEFALKLAGRIDVRAGRGAARAVRALLEVAAPLEERMGPILIQLPHSVTADRSALNCATGRPALHGRVRAPGSSTRGSCGAWSATTKAAAMTA